MSAIRLKRRRQQSPDSSEDPGDIKGKFKLVKFGRISVPYIERLDNTGYISTRFVAVRMAEVSLITDFARFLHRDVFGFNLIMEFGATCGEADLLTRINRFGYNNLYGQDEFRAGSDGLVRVECLEEFLQYLKVCRAKVYRQLVPVRDSCCGLMRINDSPSLVPYYLSGNDRFIPLWFFPTLDQQFAEHCMVKLQGWGMAFLKFCCATLGLEDLGMFEGDACDTITLEALAGEHEIVQVEEFWESYPGMPDSRFNVAPVFPPDAPLTWTYRPDDELCSTEAPLHGVREFRVCVPEVSSTCDLSDSFSNASWESEETSEETDDLQSSSDDRTD